jgi:hypothetical protein
MAGPDNVSNRPIKVIGLLLILVGSSSQDDVLRTFAEKKGLQDAVRFEGWQEPGRLPAYVQASRLCLSPLLRYPRHDAFESLIDLHFDNWYANRHTDEHDLGYLLAWVSPLADVSMRHLGDALVEPFGPIRSGCRHRLRAPGLCRRPGQDLWYPH